MESVWGFIEQRSKDILHRRLARETSALPAATRFIDLRTRTRGTLEGDSLAKKERKNDVVDVSTSDSTFALMIRLRYDCINRNQTISLRDGERNAEETGRCEWDADIEGNGRTLLLGQ